MMFFILFFFLLNTPNAFYFTYFSLTNLSHTKIFSSQIYLSTKFIFLCFEFLFLLFFLTKIFISNKLETGIYMIFVLKIKIKDQKTKNRNPFFSNSLTQRQKCTFGWSEVDANFYFILKKKSKMLFTFVLI